ncbi:hypothetical protein HK099_003244, partial [Clydaea vesicula]
MQGCENGVGGNRNYTCKFLVKTDTVLDYIAENSEKILLVATFSTLTHIQLLAPKYPNIYFTCFESFVPDNLPNNTQGISFAEEELGFMAGALAGSVSTTKVVGIVAGLPYGALTRFAYGFLKGVKYICSQCQVLGRWVPDPNWNNVTLAVAQVDEYISKSCDVIFGAAGAMGSSAIKYAASKQKFVIGVDADEYNTTFADHSDPSSEYILTSAIKKFPVVVSIIISNAIHGKFKSGNSIFGYYNNAE